MDPRELNEALAEKFGWSRTSDIDDLGERGLRWSGPWGQRVSAPHFTEDLNEIQEVLSRMSFHDLVQFVRELYSVIDDQTRHEVGMEVLEPIEVTAVLMKATAEQRAEALAKMYGLGTPIL